MSHLMRSQLTLKNSRQMLSLPGALLQATMINAAFRSSSVLGVSRKSLHHSGKFLCTSFSTRKFHLNRITFVLQKLNKDVQKSPRGRLFYTVLAIALVIIRYTRPFCICREWKREGLSPRKV